MDIIVAIISGILSGFLSYKLLKHQEKQAYTKEKYEKVVAPSFFMLEPHLYSKEINSDVLSIVSSVCDLILSNRIYISGRLLNCASFCQDELNKNNKLSEDSFNTFCSIISIEYDKCCKSLGIPKRTFSYKLRNHQIHPEKTIVLNEIVKYVTYICAFITFVTVGILIFHVLSTFAKLLA